MSAEPLAEALWEARATATPIPAERWRGLSLERAEAVARALYERETAAGGTQVGWKLGATDAAGQRALGADGPFVAPVFSTTAIAPGGRVSLGRYIAPRLEAEVGVGWRDGEPAMVSCAEIVDCRLAGWEVDLGLAVADFALQAGMIFGAVPGGWHDAVEVVVRHEGAPVARGARDGRASPTPWR